MSLTDSLAREVLDLCRARGWRLGTAESCTGGLIAGALTDIAGSSTVVEGGIISYSNALKSSLLGVPSSAIEQHGAVSAQVAAQMALGGRDRLAVDLCIAVTGIAGPDGGREGKPVGTVWFGCATRDTDRAETVRRVFPGDRAAVRAATVAFALTLMRDIVCDGEGD